MCVQSSDTPMLELMEIFCGCSCTEFRYTEAGADGRCSVCVQSSGTPMLELMEMFCVCTEFRYSDA